MISTTPIASTSLWTKLKKAHPSGGQPYNQSQIFAEEDKSLHNDALKVTAILAKTTNADISELKKNPPPSTTWSKLFQQSFNGSPILSTQETTFLMWLLMNLATTNPTTSLQAFQAQEPDKLRPTLITTLWQASQQLCGSQFLTSKTSQFIPTSQEDTYLTKALKTSKPTTATLKQTTLLQTPAANLYKKSTPQPKSPPAKVRTTNLP